MVKGVNKNVIEINDTGSEIFERIVFYVSPGFDNLSAKKLLKETSKFTFNSTVQNAGRRNSLRRRAILRRRRFIIGAVTVVIGIAALLIILL